MKSPTAEMSQMRCSNPGCRSTDIDLNESSAEAVCVRCGTVCDESTIVTAEGTEGYLVDRRSDCSVFWGGRPPRPPSFERLGDNWGKDSPVESIHDAASRGDVEAVRRLLASGASPNSFCEAPDSFRERPESFYFGVDPQGETPILALCKVRRFTDGCAACLELLRDAGADLEATDGYGLTPLHYAARRGDTKVVSLLVEVGVDVDAKTLDKETALHYAARGGDTKTVSLLVDAGVDVDAKTFDEETALYLAVRHRATGCVEVLLAAGASLNLREIHNGNTPFDVALHYGTGGGHAPPEQRARSRRTWPLFLRAGAQVPATYTDNMGAEVPTDNMDPYLVRVRNAGGFQRYSQQHLARITSILETPLLPPELVRKVLEFWLHAGYYDFEPPPHSGGGSSDDDDDSEDDSDSDYYTD